MHLAVEAIGIEGGASVVVSELLATAASDSRISRISVFSAAAPDRHFSVPDHPNLVVVEKQMAQRFLVYRAIWKQLLIGRQCRRIGVDVLVSLTGQARTRLVPMATFIHQALPYCEEALRRSPLRVRMRMAVVRVLMEWSGSAAQIVLVQTPSMAQLVRDALDVSPQIEHILPALDKELAASAASDPFPPFGGVREGLRLLYVGADHPHKNLLFAARAMSRLRMQLPGATLFITLPKDHPLAQMEGVVALGRLTRSDLASAYRNADLLCMPSLCETVGLPLVEAMSLGLPVVAADLPYAHYVCGDAAAYFHPDHEDAFVAASTSVLTDSEHRSRMIRMGLSIAEELAAAEPYRRIVDSLVALA